MAPTEADAPVASALPASASLPEKVSLHSGAALTSQEAAEVAAQSVSRVVVVAGEEDCGKTTLASSVYESFQRGPFAGHWFAGSLTLSGFEERCHLSRIASGRDTADTERTSPSSGIQFLHLSLRAGAATGPQRTLLLADVPGEVFRLARDSTAECQRLSFITRADDLLIVLDGSRAARLRHRNVAYSNCEAILRSFLDAGMLREGTRVTLLTTKWDRVARAGKESLEFVERAEARFAARFSGRVKFISAHRVAARPLKGSPIALGFGVDTLFAGWLSSPAALEEAGHNLKGSARHFHRFGLWPRARST